MGLVNLLYIFSILIIIQSTNATKTTNTDENNLESLIYRRADGINELDDIGYLMGHYADALPLYGDLSKRTVNKFKNMMLSKEGFTGEGDDEIGNAVAESNRFYIPRTMTKKFPGAILSWAIPAANKLRLDHSNFRTPGITRPAA